VGGNDPIEARRISKGDAIRLQREGMNSVGAVRRSTHKPFRIGTIYLTLAGMMETTWVAGVCLCWRSVGRQPRAIRQPSLIGSRDVIGRCILRVVLDRLMAKRRLALATKVSCIVGSPCDDAKGTTL